MNKNYFNDAIQPLPVIKSSYGLDPEKVAMRASQLPEIGSVLIRDLFPDMPDSIFPSENGIENIRSHTLEALKRVDMDMIKPGDSVNILGSHHGFTLFGGAAYAEMLKTLKDEIESRTGAKDIRLRVGVGLRFKEADEHIRRFKLDEYFNRKAVGIMPIDDGLPIETEIGTLYGIRRAYDSKWIVHAHNSDVRELHHHRNIDRTVKAFGMSYARMETRSTYHQNMGPRAANFVARAIFDSPFVQSKWAFTSFLVPTPSGITGVDADNDLYSLDERVAIHNFKTYGKVITLLRKIKDVIAVLDFNGPVSYNFAGGVVFGTFTASSVDLFDLDVPFPGYTMYTESYYDKDDKPMISEIPPLNPAIKAVVINHTWVGYHSLFWAKRIPMIVVGTDLPKLFNRDPQNTEFMKNAVIAEDLKSALNFAYRITGTDKVLVFDGAPGGINVSESLAEELVEKARETDEEVETNLIPKWSSQRGINTPNAAIQGH